MGVHEIPKNLLDEDVYGTLPRHRPKRIGVEGVRMQERLLLFKIGADAFYRLNCRKQWIAVPIDWLILLKPHTSTKTHYYSFNNLIRLVTDYWLKSYFQGLLTRKTFANLVETYRCISFPQQYFLYLVKQCVLGLCHYSLLHFTYTFRIDILIFSSDTHTKMWGCKHIEGYMQWRGAVNTFLYQDRPLQSKMVFDSISR